MCPNMTWVHVPKCTQGELGDMHPHRCHFGTQRLCPCSCFSININGTAYMGIHITPLQVNTALHRHIILYALCEQDLKEIISSCVPRDVSKIILGWHIKTCQLLHWWCKGVRLTANLWQESTACYSRNLLTFKVLSWRPFNQRKRCFTLIESVTIYLFPQSNY